MNEKKYCEYCDEKIDYSIRKKDVHITIKGVEINYDADIAFCNECGNEIYVKELNDKSVSVAHALYREKAGIITVERIVNLLEKYDISKRDLSTLLNWGEITVTRYVNNRISPNKEYSDKLISLENPITMRLLVEQNGEKISEKNRVALLKRISSLLGYSDCETGISYRVVADFFLSSIDLESGASITNLKLQKLMYYAQSWNLAKFNVPLFKANFEAWVHGPVISSLYHQYKDCGYCCISPVRDFDESLLTLEQKEILDMVWYVYGKYDAKILERLTHEEDPWLFARNGLAPDERSTEVIDEESIKKYFKQVTEKFTINSPKELNKYISEQVALF